MIKQCGDERRRIRNLLSVCSRNALRGVSHLFSSIPNSYLRKVLNELPIILDNTYERILQGIPKEKSQHVRRLFQNIVVAIGRLRVEELAEILDLYSSLAQTRYLISWRAGD